MDVVYSLLLGSKIAIYKNIGSINYVSVKVND